MEVSFKEKLSVNILNWKANRANIIINIELLNLIH